MLKGFHIHSIKGTTHSPGVVYFTSDPLRAPDVVKAVCSDYRMKSSYANDAREGVVDITFEGSHDDDDDLFIITWRLGGDCLFSFAWAADVDMCVAGLAMSNMVSYLALCFKSKSTLPPPKLYALNPDEVYAALRVVAPEGYPVLADVGVLGAMGDAAEACTQ
eukprot:PhM_4_TR9616/c0_g1_i1/m.41766